MYPSWKTSLVFLYTKLKDSLGHLCVMLTVQGLKSMSDLYPDPIIVVSVITCVSFLYPVPSHSCDLLEDLFPSLSQYGFTSALPDDEDIEFWRSYLRIHFHSWWIPLLQLSIITYWLTICWILSMFDFNNIYSHGLDCTVSLGSFMKTLVLPLWTKSRKIMFSAYTQLPDLWRLIIVLWLQSTL